MADAPGSSCLYWNGRAYDLACPDDLCHGNEETLCGLQRGFDFDVSDDGDPDDDDDDV
jgi:hypothetical protein